MSTETLHTVISEIKIELGNVKNELITWIVGMGFVQLAVSATIIKLFHLS